MGNLDQMAVALTSPGLIFPQAAMRAADALFLAR